MATFEYKGILSDTGRATKGLVEALDVKDAREQLLKKGILTQKIGPSGARGSWLKARKVFDLPTRSLMYRELGSLLKAGLPLDQAMDLLIETPELGDNATLLAGLRDKLNEGTSLAAGLQATNKKVTAFEIAVIQVGERAGTLDVVLDRLSGFLEQEQIIRERIQTALTYPAFVLILALFVAVAVLGIMLPNFQGLLEKMNVELPLLTKVVLALGEFMSRFGLILAIVIGGGIYWFVRSFRRNLGFRISADRRLFQIPIVGKAYESLINFRFSRTFALLLQGGVPVTESLVLSARASGSAWTEEEVTREAETVAGGDALADALGRVPPLAGGLPGWVRAGEASGDLPHLLESAAERYERAWERQVSRTLNLIEPILILVVGVFVLLVALAILLPILSLNQSIGAN